MPNIFGAPIDDLMAASCAPVSHPFYILEKSQSGLAQFLAEIFNDTKTELGYFLSQSAT